jgi:acetylornithine/succinyldiaminopimelate/putrescine aminotransferase
MTRQPSISDTLERMVRDKLPNFFRLYLNPFVVQTCYALSRYVERTWPDTRTSEAGWPSFIANSFDEALSGAIKLARYSSNLAGGTCRGLVLDPAGRLGPFASVTLRNGQDINFVPHLRVIRGDEQEWDAVGRDDEPYGFFASLAHFETHCFPEALRELLLQQKPLIIMHVDRATLAAAKATSATGSLGGFLPDIVVFDESFVNNEVPFAAFTARRQLYGRWMKPDKSTFHSTTFQPNTVASLHFRACLEHADPEFYSTLAPTFERVEDDPGYCRSLLADLYSPLLARAVRSLRFDSSRTRAEGHYICAGRRRIFDGVAGVACSLRGHNPPSYVAELRTRSDVPDVRTLVSEKLKSLTGLDYLMPAVSGASAVENALRIGLAAQFPKNYLLAFKGGFGGKTLLALTGTARASYKEHLHPLYENVIYIDPFGPRVIENLEAALKTCPVGLVQMELIQAVGGVRKLPEHIVKYLASNQQKWGYLLFVDEVQTGMYRTGPFLLSQTYRVCPDILALGKGTSDMMFPFSLTLFSREVREKVQEAAPDLTKALERRCDYELGYKTVLNALDQAERLHLADRAAKAGNLFCRLLHEGLRTSSAVRDIRVHGLLIGIELDTRGWLGRWLRNNTGWLYILGMLRQRSFPVFAGFCQYEPNVLKLTPPLTISDDEVRQVCATITSVLGSRLYRLAPPAVGALVRAKIQRKASRNHAMSVNHEPLSR